MLFVVCCCCCCVQDSNGGLLRHFCDECGVIWLCGREGGGWRRVAVFVKELELSQEEMGLDRCVRMCFEGVGSLLLSLAIVAVRPFGCNFPNLV